MPENSEQNNTPPIYTEEQGDQKEETIYGLKPDDLNMPDDFNPYQQQKKRIKKILRNLDISKEQLKEMSVLYDCYGEQGRAATVLLLESLMEDVKQCVLEFYVNHM